MDCSLPGSSVHGILQARLLEWVDISYVIHHINKLKNENYMITSVDSEKSFDKFQHWFMMKALQEIRIEGTYLHMMKVIYDNPPGTSFSTEKTVKNWKPFL